MRIGFLSDVHGNELALDACLERMKRLALERIVFLGDAVGYMPGELGVLERLEREGIDCQKGNHEAMLLGAHPCASAKEPVYRLDAARHRLMRAGRLASIAAWPESRSESIDGVRIWMLHGAPADHVHGYVYPDTDITAYAALPHEFVVLANTHRPFVRTAASVTVVNTGSVGLPRDRGDLASFAVIDTTTRHAVIYRVRFDVESVIARYRTEVHDSVLACLHREAPTVIGEVLT